MRRANWILTAAIAAGAALAGAYAARHALSGNEAIRQAAAPAARPLDAPPVAGRYLFNVTLHTREEIEGMLRRAEELAARGMPAPPESAIALVLHGPEILLFTRKRYAQNRALIELAERLDRRGVIEIKMCQTAMRELGVAEADVPPFISFVPFAPDEIRRLQAAGYVYF